MSGALPYLWVTTRRNAVRRYLLGFVTIRRLPAALARLAVLAVLVFGLVKASSFTQVSAAAAPALLTVYLVVVLVLAVPGGLSERGVAFRPAEVDFLFPGPFRSRSLILYHVAGLYPQTWLAAILPTALFGAPSESPYLGFAGAVLCQATALHLRLIAAILATEIGERAWQRLRAPLRLFMTAVTIVLFLLLASVIASMGGLRSAIASIATSPAARVLFFPAVAAGDLASAHGFPDALPPLLGAIAAAAATLALLLALKVNFLEASIGASERLAAVRERIRSGRGLSALAVPGRPAAGARLPTLRLFRGAGAVAWRNWLVVRRSGRRLYLSVGLVLLIFVPTFLAGGREESGALVAAAMLPFLLSSYLRFDFRGEGAQAEPLKTLPFSPTSLAAAQVAVPTAVALALQALLLAALVGLARVRLASAAIALLAYAPVTAGIFATANLAHFLGAKGSGVALILHSVFIAMEFVLLGGAGWLLRQAGFSWVVIAPILLAAQAGIVAAVLVLLGLAFSAHDVSADTG